MRVTEMSTAYQVGEAVVLVMRRATQEPVTAPEEPRQPPQPGYDPRLPQARPLTAEQWKARSEYYSEHAAKLRAAELAAGIRRGER